MTHATTIKIVALIVIVGFFFIHPVFAAGDETANETLLSIQEILNKFISLCSRGRVILAILAGKLMTNDFVYGAFLHMDIYLRKIRNIMKNFANFALVAIVIGAIIKNLVGKEAIDVKKIITNTLVAGILIQASRFLMGAVIDLSTVATAGISSFPIAFLQNDAGLKGEMNTAISKFKAKRIVIDPDATKNNITTISILGGTQNSEDLRENVLPSYNSVSGPFIFLGMGVFHFQNFLGTENTSDVKTLTLEFALRFFLLFFFTVGLFLLFIANIMRVGLLRVFIIGAPFLILIQLFKLKTEGGGGILKIFSLSNLIAIAFKPVIFVIGISLMLIVIVSMQRGMLSAGTKRESDLNGVALGVTGTTSTLTVEGITNVEVNQKDILGPGVVDEGKNIFSTLLMLLLTMFIMRRFVKLSLTLGGGPIEEVMKNLTGLAEQFAKSAPILPGKTSFTAAKTFLSKNREKMLGGVGLNKEGQFGEMGEGGAFTTSEEKFSSLVNSKLGLGDPWMEKDNKELEGLAKNMEYNKYSTFFDRSKTLANEKDGGLSVNNTRRMNSVKLFLGNSNFTQFNSTLTDDKKFDGPWTKQKPEDYFRGRNARALYEAMGGTAASGVGAPNTYEDLTKITFYATNATKQK